MNSDCFISCSRCHKERVTASAEVTWCRSCAQKCDRCGWHNGSLKDMQNGICYACRNRCKICSVEISLIRAIVDKICVSCEEKNNIDNQRITKGIAPNNKKKKVCESYNVCTECRSQCNNKNKLCDVCY